MEEFKRLELKDGKLCFDKRIVDYEILKLKTLPLGEEEDPLNEKKIANQRPQNANAYFVGEAFGFDDGRSIPQHFSPVLYLKVNE